VKKQEGITMHTLSIKKLAAGILGLAVLGTSVAFAAGAGAPTVQVSGTVTDGSGHGWPLFARVEFTSPSTDPVVAYSDPVTGAYTAALADGTTFAAAVTAVGPGYVPGGGTVVTAGAPLDADWTLSASALCNAPGYAAGPFGPAVFSESFDAGVIPPGWTVQTNSGGDWQVVPGADPSCPLPEANQTGGSGPYALANGFCQFFEDSYLVTAPIDLSSSGNAAIRWANDFIDGGGHTAEVEVSIDGGASWTSVWRAAGSTPGPGTILADMSFAAGHANVQLRFHYSAFFGLWWQVDDIAIGPVACSSLAGGLVVGSVTNANTGLGLSGATVTALADGSSTTTAPAPEQGDGYYSLFAAGSGSQDFEAAAEFHTSLTQSAAITPDAVVRLDFALAAGLLDASPRPLSAIVPPGGTQIATLDVSNTGTGEGSFVLHEIDVPPAPATEPFFASNEERREDRMLFRTGWFGATGSTALATASNTSPNVPPAAGAGNLVSSFEIDLEGAYGMTYDTSVQRLWISNGSFDGGGQFVGDGLDYQYQPDGTQTGETIDIGEIWLGDGAYNARTGTIWQPHVANRETSPAQCLIETDPVAKVVTGNQICGPWGNFPGLVGLAYDYATDTYYAGDQLGVITQVDGAGHVLSSGSIGLQISGLAYNPTTRLLYAAVFLQGPFDIYVVDPHDGYQVLSGFDVTSGGLPVLNGGGVSLEADCFGHLWIYDIFGATVLEVDSGVRGWCVDDIPWLSLDPTSGTIPGTGAGAAPSGTGNTLPITATFDSAGLFPGLHLRSLAFSTDTPTPVAPVPVSLTVLFNDVPEGSFAWNYIYGAAGAGVMPGCNPYAPAYAFCPNEIVTRRSMAGYIERAVHGALTPPPVYTGEFADVLLGSFNSDYIQGLVDDHITAGCSVEPRLYCPDVPVTRAQMAVFVWKAQHGEEAPEPCTGVFADVPCPSQFADYIEGIADEGITVGCGGGNYCPNAGITNAQMAVYLVKAFDLPYVP
jgi:hypothetical protein